MALMNRYTKANLADVGSGWYWAKHYANDVPVAVPVYWKAYDKGKLLVVDFGYCSEKYFYPDIPESSDDFDEGFVLIGPIPIPHDI